MTLSCRDRRITDGSVSSRKTQSVLYLQELTLWLLRGLAEVLFFSKRKLLQISRQDMVWAQVGGKTKGKEGRDSRNI